MAFQPPQFPTQPAFPSYGYCESYFVENHDNDDGVYAKAAADREKQRGVAKLRQKALADELSQVTGEEYQEDILRHMERMEVSLSVHNVQYHATNLTQGETMPDIQSIEIQTEIQWFMRPYLLDFLLEAHHAFQLLPETLHLTANLLDRYCSRRVVYKRHYQLVGCAALLIAAKYGDRKERVPTIRELKSMCCSLYDDDMFTQMEWHVLQTLNWVIGHPTTTTFLQLAMSEVSFDPELEHMAWYLTELALYHKEFIPVRPSVMARSSLALARCILNRGQPHYQQWSAQYDPQVVLNLSSHLAEPSQALSRKYASHHLSAASSTIEMFLARQQAIANRMAQIPIEELHNYEIQETQSATNPLLVPCTPHKVGGFHPVPAGVLTPPITPDKDYCPQAFTNQKILPHLPPCTPTPPPNAEQQQQMRHVLQSLQLPQFVQ